MLFRSCKLSWPARPSGRCNAPQSKEWHCSWSVVLCRYVCHPQPTLALGADAILQKLQIGKASRRVYSIPSAFRNELYDVRTDSMLFAGLISHSLMPRKTTEVTAGVDKATERLKAQMAAHAKEKESNKSAALPRLPQPLPSHPGFT